MRAIHLPEDELRQLLVQNDMQLQEVAAHFHVSRDTVRRNCQSYGIPTPRTGPKRGDQHPNWNGGTTVSKGYLMRYMPDHPLATKHGYVAEHRLVMEEQLGRYLLHREVVHHKNRDTRDNRPENLELYEANSKHLREELSNDPVHVLCVALSQKRSTILHQIESNDLEQPQSTEHCRPLQKRLIAIAALTACIERQKHVPNWAVQLLRQTKKHDPPL